MLSSHLWAKVDTETLLVVDYLAMYEEGEHPNMVQMIFNDELMCE